MKIILFIGASFGIGYETVVVLKSQGNKVCGGGNQQSAEKLTQRDIIPIKFNVTDKRQCKQAVDIFNKVQDEIKCRAGVFQT